MNSSVTPSKNDGSCLSSPSTSSTPPIPQTSDDLGGLDDDAEQTTRNDALIAIQLAEEEAKRELDCANDATLALILQNQFDTEYEDRLRQEEEVSPNQTLDELGYVSDGGQQIASSNSPTTTTTSQDNESVDEDAGLEEKIDSEVAAWDVFEARELKQKSRMMGRAGFVLDQDGNMITKHDIPTSSRKNMCRLMELKTDIQTGDAGAAKDDFKITNYVYNQLKVHSKKSSRRATQRLFDKREKENATILDDIQLCKMNESTRSIMNGLLLAYKIEKLNGVIGHGKESTVLHGTGRDHEDNPGQEVAIKIFKSDINVAFKTRDSYNKSKCPSYKFDKPRSKHDSLKKWAERGFKNLKLLRKAEINCPEAISLKKHVLVMTFLGTSATPAPQLRQAQLEGEQLRSSYEQVVDIMERMYKDCNLIHGDLSEYNLLWFNDKIYVIDVSQSMFASHPNANSFLYRDCKNILDFYRKSGLDDTLDEKELFTLVCGKDLTDKDVDLLSKMEDFPPNEKLMKGEEKASEKYGHIDSIAQLLEATNEKKIAREQ